MSAAELAILCAVTYLASSVGVFTGGHSMLTVPLMMIFGFPPAVAVATNRFANTFLAGVGAATYFRGGKIHLGFSGPLILAGTAGSVAGSLILLELPGAVIKSVIGACMVLLVVAAGFLRDRGLEDRADFHFTPGKRAIGLLGAFGTGIYWGFFGGGGMTVFIVFLTGVFGLSFLQSVGTSNIANFFASLMAVAVFVWQGAIHWPTGLAMAAAMAAGGWTGATFSLKVGNRWVKRIFNAVILLLALQLLTGWPDLAGWIGSLRR